MDRLLPIAHVRFGPFDLDVETGELLRRGRKIKLAPQPLRVLALLAASPGRLVTRETLRKELWRADTFVDFEHALNFCIREIRSALGDRAKRPRFIETLPRRGYRFIAEAVDGGRYVGSTAVDRPRELHVTDADGRVGFETARIQAYEYYCRARKNFTQAGKQSLEQAREDFERALSLDSEYALAHAGLGATHALRTLNRRHPEDLDKAQIHLERALELDQELAEPYPWLCYVHMRKNRLDQAIQAGQCAVQLQPALVHAHYFLGLAYLASTETDPARYQDAALHLLQASRVDPSWQPTWFVLAYLALLVGNYQYAEKFADRLVAMNREAIGLPFIGAEIVLAAVRLRQGDWQSARTLISSFLERLSASDHMYRDSMMAIAACVLGDIAMRDGDRAAALAAYRSAWHSVQEHPRIVAYRRISARAQAGLAGAYASSGERSRALKLLLGATQLAGQSELPEHNGAGASQAELYWSIAVAYVCANEMTLAIEMLRRAVRTGWRDASWLERDLELRPLHHDTEFLSLLNEIRQARDVAFE